MEPTGAIEFKRRGKASAIVVAGVILAIVGAATIRDSWFYLLALVGGVFLLVMDQVWRRSTPLITLDSHEILFRPGIFQRVVKLPGHDVGAWAHTERLLGIRTIRGETIFMFLDDIDRLDRERLIGAIEKLVLGDEESEPMESGELTRHARTVLVRHACIALVVGLAVYFVVLATLLGR